MKCIILLFLIGVERSTAIAYVKDVYVGGQIVQDVKARFHTWSKTSPAKFNKGYIAFDSSKPDVLAKFLGSVLNNGLKLELKPTSNDTNDDEKWNDKPFTSYKSVRIGRVNEITANFEEKQLSFQFKEISFDN